MFVQLHILAFTLIAIFFTSAVTAAPPLQRRIAANAVLACGPPNNSKHVSGSGCAFKDISGGTVTGVCVALEDAPSLVCQP
ncbi:hypothetical protein K438DRAFT_1962388 [Mycena galopus ATCC 62051]|nr:hypothetical protein K438DRAFT_1962388 [Mycena galopus ATCC 62051]